MASAVPLVVPNAGGVLEYASHCNAWRAAPTRRDFASPIRAAAHGDRSRTTTARETTIHFSWAAATRRYFDAYDDIYRQFVGTAVAKGMTPAAAAQS